MGGGGAMMQANQSLKNNRSLLAKRKDKQNLQGSYAGTKLAEFPRATPEQLEKIRKQIQLENQRMKIKIVFVFSLISIAVIFSIFFIF